MAENSLTIALDMSLNRMPGLALATIDARVVLRTSGGSRREVVVAVRSIRSKAVGAVVTDQIKRRNAVFIAGDSFAIDDARARA
jgi:hypothetical protein